MSSNQGSARNSETPNAEDERSESYETRSETYTGPSSHGAGSTNARKRRLELAAAEERAKIRKLTLEAKEKVDLDIINRRLAVQLAELEEQDQQERQIDVEDLSTRTQQWVDNTGSNAIRNDETLGEGDEGPRSSNDVDRLTSALTRAFATIQGGSGSNEANQQLAARLTASRELPSFDGDPLEWPRFKRAFEATTARGGYTEDENVSRLFHCLKKEAKDAVAALMITTTGASEIMETLQLRFGNPERVARKIGKEIKRLPKLDGSRGDLVTFATTVKNCVSAMEAIGHLGYLHSPELLAEIIGKIPESMVHAYNRFYHERNTPNVPKLAVLAEFLRFEADIACQAGTSDTTVRPARHERANYASRSREEDRRYEPRSRREMTFTTRSDDGRREQRRNRDCLFCESSRHKIAECERFKNEPVRKRWRWAKDSGVCFRCLAKNHNRFQCTAAMCGHTGCHRSHHILLHSEGRPQSSAPSTTAEVAEQTHTTTNTWEPKPKRVLLKVLPVKLRGPRGSAVAYALLDEGSTITLLDSELAREIGVTGRASALELHGVSQMQTAVSSSRHVNFLIGGTSHDSQMFSISDARTIPNLSLPCQSLGEEDLRGHQHLRDVAVHCYQRAAPKVLIGQDQWNLLRPLEIRASNKNAPVATRTPLGWVMHGYAAAPSRQRRKDSVLTLRATSTNEEEATEIATKQDEADRELHDIVKMGFTLEAMGISTVSRKNTLVQQAEQMMAKTARRVGERWEIGLLWKHDIARFPDTYPNALNRLKSLERKMKRDPEFGIAYKEEVRHLVEAGYARKVEISSRDRRSWYLPHFGVSNLNKPGKLRLVFDAASKVQGASLNDHLLSGPDLLNSLLGVLMRFRQKRIAFTADIKEMFLQIKIREEDQAAQLFLWRDGEARREPDIYQMTSMIFGASSSPASALYIKNRNAQEFEAEYPRAAAAIVRKHYMDDYLDSVETIEEGIGVVNDVIEVHKRGGFDIRGWISNEPRVLEHLSPDKLTKGSVSLTLDKGMEQRTLGLIWRPGDDTLAFAIDLSRGRKEILSATERPTKREMLRLIMSIFDPQGLLTPFTVGGKIMLQNVWISAIGWDEPLADTEFGEWQKWVEKLTEVPRCVIPRCYTTSGSDPTAVELHIFCDASQQASAAVGYWRFRTRDGENTVAFVAGKSRVAPTKPRLSIPRMELQAALLGARLAQTIIKEHEFKIARRTFWTDARCVLSWIQSDPRKHNAWLANRLGEIDELSNAEEWRWVSTKQNPADDATRSTGEVPSEESRWFRGPEFLRDKSSTNWPQTVITKDDYDNSEDTRVETVTHVIDSHSGSLPDVERFSSWIRLIRSTARVLLFIDVMRAKAKPELTNEYVRRAEQIWIRHTQQSSFNAEWEALRNGEAIAKNSRLIQVTPILDEDGILRVKGRIQSCDEISTDTKTPVIIDGRHPYTRLMVMHYHQKAGHGSPETVLNELRQRFWIVHGRPTIRSVTASCQWCHVQRAKPQIPFMGNLPSARLAHHKRPFTCCGVDYFGPMLVTVGRRHEKRWGVLFTCLTTRAVHLEMATSLTTDSAIMALRRFAARRGYPTEVYSDNGTNFRGAAIELRREIELLDHEKLRSEAVKKNMVWRFIPPFSPHMGGSWERLVRSVKVALSATLKERAPKEEVLATLMAEAEHAVNSRPLSHVSTDPRDPETLTPNHFLIGTSSGSAIPTTFHAAELSSRKQWLVAQRLADMFWARWLKEYVPTLQTRKKWNVETTPVQAGDVVFLIESSTPRNVWNRGLVTRVIPGPDGRVRVAEVRIGDRVFIRAVAKMITLARSDGGTDPTTSVPGGSMSPTQTESETSTRSHS